MKKPLSILLAAALLALAGCNGGTAAPAASGSAAAPAASGAPAADGSRETLTMWFWGASPAYQEHLNKVLGEWYYNSQDQYQLALEFRNTVDADIPVALAAGQGPDIVYASGPSYTATYAQENLVVDLTPYAEKYGWKDRILGVMYDACTVDGKLYSLPGGMLVGGVFYSTELFTESGWSAPKTLDDMVKIMDSAKEKGLYPLGAGNKGWKPNNDHYSSMIMNAYLPTSTMYDALTGTIGFEDQRIVDAVQVTADWYQKGYLAGNDYPNMEASDVVQTLMDKKSAMVAAPSLFFQWIDNAYGDKIAFIPMPNNYSDKDVFSVSMACNFAINANSKAPDEAAKILDYMMTGEFAQKMSEQWPAYWVLPVKELPDMKTDALSGLSKTCFEAVQKAIPSIDAGNFAYHPSTFYPAATVTAFQDIDTVWQGVVSAKDFCATVGKELKSDIEKKLVAPLAKPSV